MHTGVISFADRIAHNIKSSDVKDVILQEIDTKFGIKILQKHWFPLDVKQIKRNPHMACLRSNGNPYYMYFTRYDDVPIIYFIDKKIQPGYEKPRIILCKSLFDECVFKDTILEGEMVKTTQKTWLFLINDVIAFEGKRLEEIPLPKRLTHAYTIFGTKFHPDPVFDVCDYQVKQYAYATQDGIHALCELSTKLPYTNRGIYFWPMFMKHKPLLYNFDESLIKDVVRKVKDNPEFRVLSDSLIVSPVTDDVSVTEEKDIELEEGQKCWWLRKTENPDIYDLCCSNMGKKEGVAHIPNLQTSKLLRSVFKDLTVAVTVPFICTFNDTFQKWQPIRRIS
jgi:hypothetical protein